MRRRALLAGLGLGAAGLLGGCADLPMSGPVTRSDADLPESNRLVQSAAGPAVGASVEQIVEGFLRACAAGFSDRFATARSFLADPVRSTWLPQQTVRVYSQAEPPSVGDPTSVSVRAELSAQIDSQGRLSAVSDPSYTASFTLRVDSAGQWRIKELPDGVLLPDSGFLQEFSSVGLCFLTTDGVRLVPETRWLSRDQRAYNAVRMLLEGPSPWLEPGVRTAVPSGTTLAGTSAVDVQSKRATVRLSHHATTVSGRAQGEMYAQIQQTLLQLDGVETVQVLVTDTGGNADTATRPVSVVSKVEGLGAQDNTVVALADGAVVRGLSAARSVLVTAERLGTTSARWPALGAHGEVVALSGPSMLLGPRDTGAARVIYSQGDSASAEAVLKPPVIDRHGWIWTAAGGALTAVNDFGVRADLDVPWGPTSSVRAVDLSAESERVALLRETSPGVEQVEVAVITRGNDRVPTGVTGEQVLMVSVAGQVKSLAWADTTTVAVLATSAEGALVVRHLQVGGVRSQREAPLGSERLTGSRTDGSLLVTDSSGQTWQNSGASWQVVATDVTDVSYSLT